MPWIFRNFPLTIILVACLFFLAVVLLYCDNLSSVIVYGQTELDMTSSSSESVTSTYDALIKVPLLISQTAILGTVFNYIFVHRVFSKRIMVYCDIDSIVKNNLRSSKTLFIILIGSSIAILTSATGLMILQAVYLSSELGLDISTTFTILTSTSVGEVWILRIITSLLVTVFSLAYYISEKKKIMATIPINDKNVQRKNMKLNQILNSIPVISLYIIMVVGAISIFSNSMLGHNAALSFLPSLAIFLDWLHFVAVSIWVGGFFYISTILVYAIREAAASTRTMHKDEKKDLQVTATRASYSLTILLPHFSLIAVISLGIIGTMFIVLYFSRKQAQGFTVDIETKILNDLDEKVRKMAEIIIEKPSLQKVMYKLEKPSEELAFAYYILFISSHVYSMHQRNVLKDDEWTRWLYWMRNCFRYGTLGEYWKQTQSENWFDPSFQAFVSKELIPGTQK